MELAHDVFPVDRTIDFFRVLRNVVAANEVRLHGIWSGKSHRRYASPEQAGSGEGPYVETVDWLWEGTLESASPFVGIAVLARDEGFYWVKSDPPTVRGVVTVSASAWAARPASVSFTGAFHGAHPPSVPVDVTEDPPASCVIGASRAAMGMLHVVAQLGRAAFGVVLLPASAVKVGRNRLWHLREAIGQRLSPELQRLLSRGRSGDIKLTD